MSQDKSMLDRMKDRIENEGKYKEELDKLEKSRKERVELMSEMASHLETYKDLKMKCKAGIDVSKELLMLRLKMENLMKSRGITVPSSTPSPSSSESDSDFIIDEPSENYNKQELMNCFDSTPSDSKFIEGRKILQRKKLERTLNRKTGKPNKNPITITKDGNKITITIETN